MAVAVFLQETQGFGITPGQYGALLEARGLLRPSASTTDRRVKLLGITEDGAALLADMQPQVAAAQARMLAPLTDAENPLFMDMLTRLVLAHQETGRVPPGGE